MLSVVDHAGLHPFGKKKGRGLLSWVTDGFIKFRLAKHASANMKPGLASSITLTIGATPEKLI